MTLPTFRIWACAVSVINALISDSRLGFHTRINAKLMLCSKGPNDKQVEYMSLIMLNTWIDSIVGNTAGCNYGRNLHYAVGYVASGFTLFQLHAPLENVYWVIFDILEI